MAILFSSCKIYLDILFALIGIISNQFYFYLFSASQLYMKPCDYLLMCLVNFNYKGV